jgi:hypothetical protein
MLPRCLLTAALALAPTAAFAADSDGLFDRSLTLSGAASVSVSSGAGYIHISPGPGNQVHIAGHVRAHAGWLDSSADARVRQIVANPPIVQSGNVVTIGPGNADQDLYRNITIDYDVTVPRSTTLKAGTGSGDIQIDGINGALTAGTGSGGIKVDDIGPNARIGAGSGSIRASNVHGAAVLQTGSGEIDLSLTAAGDVTAQTGSGSIHIDGLTGALRARSGSGSIAVDGNPTAEWRLETGSGAVHLNLPAAARFNLDAGTGSGAVQVDRPILMQGSLNRHHVSGAVNGGGPTIHATTGSGSILIR